MLAVIHSPGQVIITEHRNKSPADLPMKMHLDNTSSNLVSEYGDAGIGINGKTYQTNLIVDASTVIENWEAGSIESLTIDQLSEALALSPEILLLGTGSTHIFPPMRLQAELSGRGTALEVMTTSAACRTYNVLVAEYREVAAALIQLGD